MNARPVSLSLTDDDLARLDELRPAGCTRSAFVRELLRRAAPLTDSVTYDEAIVLLAESARGGSVTARIALERALRSDGKPVDAGYELDRLLSGAG